LGFLWLSACSGGTSYQLKGTDVTPGADATLNASVDPERHVTSLALEAKNLAPPARVLDGGTTYVLWARPQGQSNWLRLGALDLGDDSRSGKTSVTVSETAFELVVTAEVDSEVDAPSDKRVFEQQIGRS